MASFCNRRRNTNCMGNSSSGCKNEVLQVVCATLLTDEEVTISNIPNILDVNNLIQLLRDMGVPGF